MTKKHSFSLLLSLLLLGFVIGLSGCAPGSGSSTGSGTPPGDKPTSVQIKTDEPLPPNAKPKPDVTLTDGALVQQLYTTIYALPQMPENQACTTELGPHYILTFFQDTQTLVTVLAMRDGCRPVSISGETGDRQGTAEFWALLDQAIYHATPVAVPQQVAIAHTPDSAQPPQTAQITSAQTAQRLYNAILALPLSTSKCADLSIPEYQLAFQTSDQSIPAAIYNHCNFVSLDGANQTRGSLYTMNDQFRQMFTEIIAGATFAPASPDQLALSVQDASTAQQSIITDGALRQQLYQKVFTLQPTTPQPDCPSNADKMAGKGIWYMFAFSQWSLPLLQVSAYEGSCTSIQVSPTNQLLQGDQEFWNLVHQAAGQQ